MCLYVCAVFFNQVFRKIEGKKQAPNYLLYILNPLRSDKIPQCNGECCVTLILEMSPWSVEVTCATGNATFIPDLTSVWHWWSQGSQVPIFSLPLSLWMVVLMPIQLISTHSFLKIPVLSQDVPWLAQEHCRQSLSLKKCCKMPV